MSLEPKQVSEPSTDVAFSSFGGFTQSETATAWCGDNVVVGFNDSGSIFETSSDPRAPIGMSFVGFARSIDQGGSFTDMGFLHPGPGDNFLGGDPVFKCTDPFTFYGASLLLRLDVCFINTRPATVGAQHAAPLLPEGYTLAQNLRNGHLGTSAISVSKSTDGGATWSAPVAVQEVCGFVSFVQGSQVAVGPRG